MGFLKTIRKRSFLNEAAYVGLNIALAAAVLIIVWTVASPVPALLLVLLSKWRVVAVRPRYWVANILANLVDVVVGVGVVLLMYSVIDTPYALYVQTAFALLFAGWLIGLKPQSSRRAVVLQAFIALLVGSATLFVLSHTLPISVIVIGMAGLGYVTARHVLGEFEEDHLQFLALVWALVMAQVAWVFAHWTVSYSIPVIEIAVPQATIVFGLAALVSYLSYASFREHGRIRSADIAAPLAFSISLVLVLLIFFSKEFGAL